jgi:thymidylate synthase (FAD)
MKVSLINDPSLIEADWAAGECYDKGCYSDPKSREKRLNNLINVYKHSSIAEFIEYTFEIEASTKVLLEMTRHRHANYACKSSRYTLNKGELLFEKTGDPEIDIHLGKWAEIINDMIQMGKPNDVVSLMLPQAYQYRWVAKFNARSLQNFFELRLDKHAHYHIREVAEKMYSQIPEDHKFLFEEIYNNKTKSK